MVVNRNDCFNCEFNFFDTACAGIKLFRFYEFTICTCFTVIVVFVNVITNFIATDSSAVIFDEIASNTDEWCFWALEIFFKVFGCEVCAFSENWDVIAISVFGLIIWIFHFKVFKEWVNNTFIEDLIEDAFFFITFSCVSAAIWIDDSFF